MKKATKTNKKPVVLGITLLSVEEYEAAAQYIKKLDAPWWLRTKGIRDGFAVVATGGQVNEMGVSADQFQALRPALVLASNIKFNVSDEFEFGQRDWTVIPGNYAICNMYFINDSSYVAFSKFKNVDFEHSDIYDYLTGWFERNKKGEVHTKTKFVETLADDPKVCCAEMGRFMERLGTAKLLDDPALQTLLRTMEELETAGYTKTVKKRLHNLAEAVMLGYAAQHSGEN